MQGLDLHLGPVLKIMGNAVWERHFPGQKLEIRRLGKTGILGREKGRDLGGRPSCSKHLK